MKTQRPSTKPRFRQADFWGVSATSFLGNAVANPVPVQSELSVLSNTMLRQIGPDEAGKAAGRDTGAYARPTHGDERRLYDPQRPFTPQWQLRVNKRPLVRGASMPAAGHFRLSTRSDSLL